MARGISDTQEAAQKAVSSTPYIRLVFSSKGGGTTHNYSSRLLQLEHHEEPYNDYATIILKNEDLEIVDLTGYWVEIGYGHTTGAGDEYAATPRLWVKAQSEISMEGKLAVVLYLEGVWAVLAERMMIIGSPPFYVDEPYTGITVYSILEDIIETELSAATGFSFTLDALGTQNDGIVNNYTPVFEFNESDVESMSDIIQTLMAMTKCYLRAESGLQFKVVYPQTTDSINETYYSDQTYYFFEYSEVRNVVIPNRIILFANAGEDESWSNYITADIQDTSEVAKYMEVAAIYYAAEITNQTDADNRANAILAKSLAELTSGRLIIPHDARMELYDRVEIQDTRGE